MLAPDYEISEAKVLQLFKKFAVFDTNHHRSLRIRSCANGKSPIPMEGWQSLPSWVPDWRCIHNTHPFVRYGERTQFSASARMTPVAWYSEKTHILNVTGKVRDSISMLGPNSAFSKAIAIFEIDEAKINALRASSEWLEACRYLALDGYDSTIVERHEYFWKTMLCGLTGEGFPAPKHYSKYFNDYMNFISEAPQRFYDYMTESKALPQEIRGLDEFIPNFEKHALIEASLNRWSSPRRFCVTRNRLLAFVPPNARQEGIITILFGGDVPYVLRPLNNSWFNVIGECYVDGIMYGEGLSDDASERIFPLW